MAWHFFLPKKLYCKVKISLNNNWPSLNIISISIVREPRKDSNQNVCASYVGIITPFYKLSSSNTTKTNNPNTKSDLHNHNYQIRPEMTETTSSFKWLVSNELT